MVLYSVGVECDLTRICQRNAEARGAFCMSVGQQQEGW